MLLQKNLSRKISPEKSLDFWSQKSVCVCVCCIVLLTRYWGIVTVPGPIPFGSRPGVVGSSPFTLSTSLTIPVPSSSSSNGPSNYSVDNHGLLPWRLRRLGKSKVRSDSSVRCVPGSKRQTRGSPGSLTISITNDHHTEDGRQTVSNRRPEE